LSDAYAAGGIAARVPGPPPQPGPARRGTADPLAVARVGGALGCVLLALLVVPPEPVPRGALLGAALLLLPADLLPVIVVVVLRDATPVLGPCTAGDLVALLYLARALCGAGFLPPRPAPSRVVLCAFLAWAAIVTVAGVGQLTALGRIALYAAVGLVVAHRPRGRPVLFAGIVAFAVTEVVLHVPHLPDRLWGIMVHDPAQMGGLITAALIVVWCAAPRRAWRTALLLVLLAGAAATLTRSVWFAVAMVALAAALPRRWYVPVLLTPLCAGAALLVVPRVTEILGLNADSGALRINAMRAGLRMFADSPLTGHGWAFESAQRELGLVGFAGLPSFNMWIALGVYTGLLGIALFLVFTVLVAREAAEDGVAYLTLVATLALSLTENPIYALSLPAILFLTLTSVRDGPRRAHPTGRIVMGRDEH